jgi:hypothetical protein
MEYVRPNFDIVRLAVERTWGVSSSMLNRLAAEATAGKRSIFQYILKEYKVVVGNLKI